MYVASTEKTNGVRKYDVKRAHPRHFLSVPVSIQRFLVPEIQRSHGLTLDLSNGGASAVFLWAFGDRRDGSAEAPLP
jgi:hypothetical protein